MNLLKLLGPTVVRTPGSCAANEGEGDHVYLFHTERVTGECM